jgi:hypothetical protein
MKIEVGKTYLTRDGQKARVICTDKKGKSGRSVVVLVLESKDTEHSITLYSNGAVYTGETSDLDLVSEYKEPVKIVRYFNVYADGLFFDYPTREHADGRANDERIACKRVEFTEGEFDE